MKFRLFPRDEKFFDLFELQAQKLLGGARLILELFDNIEDSETITRKIKEVESEGDDVTHEIIARLNRTFVTPIDREDIHNLASKLDDVLDYMQAVSERINLFKIEKSTGVAREFGRVLLKSTEELVNSIGLLHDMRNSDKIMVSCIEINRLENEADNFLRKAIADLFEMEENPMEVMKWKEIYDNLENAVDSCEDVANIIEGVVLKYS